MGLIQGYDAVVSFYKNDWVPFVCATDISISHQADLVPTRTRGDGHYKKQTYQLLSWSVTLSGLLKFDDANWTGWDFIENQKGFSNVIIRASFTDDSGNVRSIQGECVVANNTISISPGALVKQDISLEGDGELKYFDGIFPCSAAITGITVTGQTAPDGIIHVNYGFTGGPSRVKWRVDGMGTYSYAVAGDQINIIGLAVGDHSIGITPVCPNDYEGVEVVQSFTVSKSFSCTLAVIGITPTVTGSTVSFSITLNAPHPFGTKLKYSIDGLPYQSVLIGIGDPVVLLITGQTIGAHTINIIPICANGVSGTGMSRNYSVATGGAAVSMINWVAALPHSGDSLFIYKNGALVVSQSASGSGSFTALSTEPVKAILQTRATGLVTGELNTHNNTTSTTLDDQLFSSPNSVSYTFTPTSGNAYTINGTVNV